MQLNHLRSFYEVARHGSFTRASQALRVSQPSLSKMVKILETEENVRLLDRNRRGGIALTPVGRSLFQRLQPIFEEIGNLRSVIEKEKDECAGELKIGCSDNVGNYILPEVFHDFLVEYPNARPLLFGGTSESIQAEMVKSNVELGLFYAVSREDVFHYERLGFVEFVVVHAPNGKSRLHLKDLAKNIYVSSRSTDYGKPFPALRMLQSLGIVPRHVFESSQQETQKRLVLKGIGYGVFPKFMVKNELETGALKLVSIPKKIGSEIYLVRRKNRTLSRTADVFAATLKNKIRTFLA